MAQVLAIGDSVRLSVTAPCPRCVMTTLPQGDLPKDTGILRTAARHNRANVGIYASDPLRGSSSLIVMPSMDWKCPRGSIPERESCPHLVRKSLAEWSRRALGRELPA